MLRCLKQKCVNKKVAEQKKQETAQKEQGRAPFASPEPPTEPVSGEEPAVDVCEWFPDYTYNENGDQVLLTTLHVSTIWSGNI